MRGSNAASLQPECIACHMVMPGLCYPKAKRNTDESEQCHGCRVVRIIYEQTAMVWGYAMGYLDNQDFHTMEHYPMWVYKIAPDTYPYIRAPLATKFNNVCPNSLNNQMCKLDKRGTNCTLRKAWVCCLRLGVNFYTNSCQLRTDEGWEHSDQSEGTLKTCAIFLQHGNCLKHQNRKCSRGHEYIEERKLMRDPKVLSFHSAFNMSDGI